MKERLPSLAAALGLLGSAACSVAMLMALVGLLGAGVAASTASTGEMGGMTGTPSSPAPAPHNSTLPSPLLTALFFLVESGPFILIFPSRPLRLRSGSGVRLLLRR